VFNQAAQYSGGGHTQIYAGNSVWNDYTLQADIRLASLSNWPGGIRGRVQPSTGGSYTVWLYPGDRQIRLYRTQQWNIDAGFAILGTASVNFDTTNFHTVKLSLQGSQLQVFYDGVLVLTATDATYPSGMVALDVSNQLITFDNILVVGNSPVTPGSLSPANSSLNFAGPAGGANPTPQAVQLSATGTGTLAWSATSSAPWITVSPSTGSTPASLQVSVSTAGLSTGTYTGAIRLVSLGDPASPEIVTINLTVR